MLEWIFHGNLCRTIGPLTLHSQEIMRQSRLLRTHDNSRDLGLDIKGNIPDFKAGSETY